MATKLPWGIEGQNTPREEKITPRGIPVTPEPPEPVSEGGWDKLIQPETAKFTVRIITREEIDKSDKSVIANLIRINQERIEAYARETNQLALFRNPNLQNVLFNQMIKKGIPLNVAE